MKAPWCQLLAAFCLPPMAGASFIVALYAAIGNHDLFGEPVKGLPGTQLVEMSKPLTVASIERKSADADERNYPAGITVRRAVPVDIDMVKGLHFPSLSGALQADRGKESVPDSVAGQKSGVSLGIPIPAAPKASEMTGEPRKWRPILDPVSEFWPSLWPRTDALPAVFQAVLLRDAGHVAHLVAMGFDPSEKTRFGDTPLCAAVRSGQADMVWTLALCGVNLNEPGRENQAPILIASMRRNAPVLAALTSLGVDPNTRFKTPVSKELIADCGIKDLRNAMESDRGVTPLICCAARGDVEGAATLMKAGAKAGLCTTRYRRYPIHFAATQGYLFLMRVLLGRDPDAEPDTLVTVDLSSQLAWVTKKGRVIATTSVSTGREGYQTPEGRYVITDKHRTHTSTLYHCAMPWFMRLNCSPIGLHSGYVTGRPASHGCIRLPHEHARLFFSLTDVGDEVQIVR